MNAIRAAAVQEMSLHGGEARKEPSGTIATETETCRCLNMTPTGV